MNCYKFIIALLFLSSCAATSAPKSFEKINGVSLEAPSKLTDEKVMSDLVDLGTDHVCLMPYAYQKAGSPEVSFDNMGGQWSGERTEGVRLMCENARDAGLSILLKPHLWIGHGAYTGSLEFHTGKEQHKWNESYRHYIMHYARVAEELDVEILCIGTELCAQIGSDPDFWKSLITDIRSVYNGKLTYAANWDCYNDFPFWTEMDYIGIDAYFPLVSNNSEKSSSTVSAWDQWKTGMKSLSDSTSRPILFTEYGYRSCKGALEEPWITQDGLDSDMDIQIEGYKSLYKAIWMEPWFAGGFLWKWHCKEHLNWGDRSSDFTPQNKPVLEVIKSWYKDQSFKNEE